MALLETFPIDGHDYTFQQLRRALALMVPQEGVVGAGDYKASAGAGMSVNVAAGDAYVQMDSGTANFLYHQANDAAVNVAVAAAHATLPRLDQILLTINDSNVAGGSDVAVLSCLAGTATSGATLDNRTGATGVPRNALRLADVLVPAASASVSAGNVRDRRPWAHGAYRRILRSNLADLSFAHGAGRVVMDATNLAPRIEASGAPLTVAVRGTLTESSTTIIGSFQLDAGASINIGAPLVQSANPGSGANWFVGFNFAWDLFLTAGSYVVAPRAEWQGSTATGTIKQTASNPLELVIFETPRANTDNS